VAKVLSSREFYKMIGVLDEILLSDETFILDLSEVMRIDAVVIPNLLFAGKYIEKKTGNIPFIRLGEDWNAGYIKNYLSNINFYELSNEFYYYENEDMKYGGLVGKKMDRRNTTQRFDYSCGLMEAQRRLYYGLMPYIEEYLKTFDVYNDSVQGIFVDSVFKQNDISYLLSEMIENSFEYAKSDNIITVQSNYKKGKIFISASDFGMGFYQAMISGKNMDDAGNFLVKPGKLGDAGVNILERYPKNEEEAIIIGLYKRMKSKKYGLYNIVKKVLELNGIVRIHSQNRQIILTSRLMEEFLDGTLSYTYNNYRGYNIISTKEFDGVHYELELPLSIYSQEN